MAAWFVSKLCAGALRFDWNCTPGSTRRALILKGKRVLITGMGGAMDRGIAHEVHGNVSLVGCSTAMSRSSKSSNSAPMVAHGGLLAMTVECSRSRTSSSE